MAAKRGSAAARVQDSDTTSAAPRLQRPRTHARDLDRLVHDRTRLAIVSALAAHEPLTFTELRTITETTDGNLSVHTRKLEDAGYVTCTKGFEGRTPRTAFALTAAGRRALQKYLDHMEAIISAARRKAR
jgi:DNA-binding transcriptional ArsR family regulator